MFQLVSFNCKPITTDMHEESGFTFSLVSHYLRKVVKISLLPSHVEIEQVCSLSFSLRRARAPPSANPGGLLTTSRLSTFPASNNFKLSFTATIHVHFSVHPRTFTTEVPPSFYFYEFACPTCRFMLTGRPSSDPQTHRQPSTSLSYTFLPKDIFFTRETQCPVSQCLNFSRYINQNSVKHGTSAHQEVRRQKRAPGGFCKPGCPLPPSAFLLPLVKH